MSVRGAHVACRSRRIPPRLIILSAANVPQPVSLASPHFPPAHWPVMGMELSIKLPRDCGNREKIDPEVGRANLPQWRRPKRLQDLQELLQVILVPFAVSLNRLLDLDCLALRAHE